MSSSMTCMHPCSSCLYYRVLGLQVCVATPGSLAGGHTAFRLGSVTGPSGLSHLHFLPLVRVHVFQFRGNSRLWQTRGMASSTSLLDIFCRMGHLIGRGRTLCASMTNLAQSQSNDKYIVQMEATVCANIQ